MPSQQHEPVLPSPPLRPATVTVTRPSQAIHVPLDQEIADQDYPVLAQRLLSNPKYDGGTVLVCWHHGHLPDLAEELGATPDKVGGRWDPAVFNLIWQLDYPPGTNTPTLTRITEPF
jgi:hypothetical protein